MLDVRILRELSLAPSPGSEGTVHLSAASGLVRIGTRLFVVADDETHLGLFDLSNHRSGQTFRLFDDELPTNHKARKAAKPDCEALLELPAFAGYPWGALMALGSGSRPSRQRAALVPLDSAGELREPVRGIDLEPLLTPLRGHFPDLNIEGAFISGDKFCLLQRGNSGSGVNACIELSWADVWAWIGATAAAPAPHSITQFALGSIGGVPLSFTDAAALPGGGWLFSAAAEATSNSYNDGACAGSAVGIVDAGGTLSILEPLSLNCKVEGVAVSASADALDLLLVTDADDRKEPALLLAADLRR
jgi:hypothetical protein